MRNVTKRRASPEVLEAIAAIVGGDRVSTNSSVLEHHCKGETYHDLEPADAVVFAETTEEVSAIARICNNHSVPVIPFGTGTSVEGGTAAPFGGICVDLSRMNDVLHVSREDMDAKVQAGVTRKQLNSHLRDTGLFFPIDPGADASIGGMASTRASGTNAVRYGTMKDNLLGLTVVLPNGSVVHTGGRAKKSSAGYDLTRLFCGAEGTLGIITEVTVRLHGIPEKVGAATCAFRTIEDAVECVIAVIQHGIPIARVELVDEVQIKASNSFSKLSMTVAPTLFMEFHGSPASVNDQIERVTAIAEDVGGSKFEWADDPEHRDRLWQARHDAYYAILALKPGSRAWTTDTCVPISHLADCILAAKKSVIAHDLTASIVGHVGDGNFHSIICIDPNDRDEVARARAFNSELVERAISVGGTCTGEHGIGVGKIPYLAREQADAMPLMWAIKTAIDPKNVMNPGKVLPMPF